MDRPFIRAVTFDLWDTVLIDDSDEPKRKALGLLPKPAERRRLLHEFLERHAPIPRELVDAAYDTVNAAFHRLWRHHHITWTVRERLETLLSGLARKLPEQDLARLVRLHEEMEFHIRPDLAPGVRQALSKLRERFRLGVISDTVFSPGRTLREILKAEGLFDLFDALVFSDEVGRSKPHPDVFRAAADLMGFATEEMLHVGDRESNDVLGPHRVGARAVLVTVVRDRRQGPSEADAVCEDYARLPDLVDALNRY